MFAVPAAILAGSLAGGLASAGPAQASPAERASSGHLSVTINAMTPSYAKPGATVRLSGTVTNGTRQRQAGLNVRLFTSASHFTTRDGMDAYVSRGKASDLVPAGNPFFVSASLAPGTITTWTASFQAGTQGIASFGVYGVTAQLQDFSGNVISADQTLLPFWPGSRVAALASPLKISWLWPLIGQPQQKVCTATLATNDLAGDLGQGGRLSALLDAGASHPGARLTWVVDPALLSDVSTMTGRYQVGGQPTCTGAARQPASAAAANWLTALRKVTSDQPPVLTPYANVDMAALVHKGLTRNLATAYRTGDAVADSVLRGTFGHDVAWPPGGTADLSLLTNLAAIQHVSTVVLNSSQMPPVNADAHFRPDDAVASLRVAGLPMNVLLSDNTLTGVLRAGNTSSGTLAKSTEFAVRQRFLAETAMIAAEAPDSRRTIVVAPPGGWSPSEALASDLLGETATTPWLTPTALTDLSSAADTERAVPRESPPASKASPGELSRSYLNAVRVVGDRLGVYQSMLYRPTAAYTRSLDEALLATQSAAWRDGGQQQGMALTRGLSDYVTSAEKKVKIISSAQVPMGGASGLVPVTIENGLHQAIRVRVVATVDNTPGRTSQLTIGHFQDVVTIPPQSPSSPVRLPVSSAPQGSTRISLSLTSANGTALHFADKSLTVQSTRYGRAILFLIGAAIGVFVLTSLYRAVRRRLHDDTNVVSEEAGPPGSVVTGTSDARHPTEAPDDLADARRWVDDA
ncbi:MAG TPA: DUF6049 family protein [Streptosporangiaceae bacterium]|nr:DUF6049 family protein [Streptosporangiaceae bacterium]